MPLEDRQRLDAFVDECYQLLRTVVFEYRGWLPDELRDAYEVAFISLETSRAELRRALVPEMFVSNIPYDDDYLVLLELRLEQAGLVGPQWALKEAGWKRALDRFRRFPTRFVLRGALKWANVILGSLAGVVGAAETLKEFKEAVEAGIEDDDGPS